MSNASDSNPSKILEPSMTSLEDLTSTSFTYSESRDDSIDSADHRARNYSYSPWGLLTHGLDIFPCTYTQSYNCLKCDDPGPMSRCFYKSSQSSDRDYADAKPKSRTQDHVENKSPFHPIIIQTQSSLSEIVPHHDSNRLERPFYRLHRALADHAPRSPHSMVVHEKAVCKNNRKSGARSRHLPQLHSFRIDGALTSTRDSPKTIVHNCRMDYRNDMSRLSRDNTIHTYSYPYLEDHDYVYGAIKPKR